MLNHLTQILRALRRAPAYTVVAALTLAVGIGATTGLVSITDAIVVRALPYRDAGSLAVIVERNDRGNSRGPSYPTFKDYLPALGGPVAGLAYMRGQGSLLRTRDGLEQMTTWYVTPGFFGVIGAEALRGRTFAPDEEQASGNRVAVISYDCWNRRFGLDPGVVGRTIDLDSVPTTVIGVMPPGFTYPFGGDAWLPVAPVESTLPTLQNRNLHADSRAIVRLRAPADSAHAADALAAIENRLSTVYPAESARWTGIVLWPMRNQIVGSIGRSLWLLTAAAVLVLLIACANVATLALVRTTARVRELAVRAALGASRGRMLGEVFAETSVVTVAGGAGGALIAAGLVRAVRHTMPQLPRAAELAVDARVLAIAVGVSAVAALLAGIAPAVRATRVSPAEELQGTHHEGRAGRRDRRLRAALVAAQVAISVTLLVNAALLAQRFRRLAVAPDEYDRDHVATVAINPPSPAYDSPAAAAGLFARVRDAVARVPGVDGAAMVNHIGGRIPSRVDIPGRPIDVSPQGTAMLLVASPEYQRVMGLRMASGRWLNDADLRAPDASGFVVNETMARRFFPTGDAVGQTITVHRAAQRPSAGDPLTGPIVGVVRDVHWAAPDLPPPPEVYVPYTREVWTWMTLVAQAREPALVAPAIRAAIQGVDPNIPVGAQPGPGGVMLPQRFTFGTRELALSTLGAFALVALALAAVGLYGTVAFEVAQRTREIGIRVALGATFGRVAGLVLGTSLRMAVAGLAFGAAAAAASTRLVRSLLFETTASDAGAWFTVPAVLAITVVAAAWLPLQRAKRIDAAAAMRGD
ncbi:MAG: ADOP family duplicated permease [Gemmatimonadota bacterium]|nr:ADOP family duplicated permease [Gemmatimonadota bacterium]